MSLTIDRNGWLVSDAKVSRVFYVPTVRTTALDTRAPVGIVWHTTGGVGGRGSAERLVQRIQTYRKGVDRPASFHLLIERNGTVYQCAPFSVGTWHVGRAGEVGGRHFANVNRATIAVELENAGTLITVRDGFYTWPFFANPGAPAQERRPDPRCLVGRTRAALFADGRFYDGFPPAQLAAAADVLQACVRRYRLTRAAAGHGHGDFTSGKTDPGALWMRGILPRLLDSAFGAAEVAKAQISEGRGS
ncbi:MAG TPA: peptidoglycan recognition family protein [Polyangia bacterium]